MNRHKRQQLDLDEPRLSRRERRRLLHDTTARANTDRRHHQEQTA